MTDWRKTSGTNHNQRLIALLKDGLGNPYDVTFVVGPAKEEVKGHQFILKLHSPVFEEKFKKENQPNPVVCIQDGHREDFEQFLQILYTGVMCDQPNQATKLLKYAVEFQIGDLEEWCWKSLEQITEESAVTIYEFATKFRKNSLRNQALQFILSNARTILDSDEFLKFTSHNLFYVLSSDELAATNETQVFKAVVRWGKEMCKRDGVQPTGSALRNVLTDLLPMIRFPVMSKSDFSMLVAPLELLTDKELISSLLYGWRVAKGNEIPSGPFNGKERNWFKEGTSEQDEYAVHHHELIPSSAEPSRNYAASCVTPRTEPYHNFPASYAPPRMEPPRPASYAPPRMEPPRSYSASHVLHRMEPPRNYPASYVPYWMEQPRNYAASYAPYWMEPHPNNPAPRNELIRGRTACPLNNLPVKDEGDSEDQGPMNEFC